MAVFGRADRGADALPDCVAGDSLGAKWCEGVGRSAAAALERRAPRHPRSKEGIVEFAAKLSLRPASTQLGRVMEGAS
jgi:hypothetical protein